MQPYYYMVYALRRILGSDGDARDFGEWRAVAFFLMIQVELLVVLVVILAPGLFREGTAIAWCLGVAIPTVIATYWVLGRQERYARYAARFNSWSSGKRAMADVGALLFGAVAVAAPFLAKSLVG